jgi:hypothetical protein
MDTEQPKSDSAYTSALAGKASKVSEARHTPAPWVLGDTRSLQGREGTYREILDDGGHMGSNILGHVCVAHPYNHDLQRNGEANARLIIASPRLLAALQEVLERIIPGSLASEVRNRAESAIAAATGTQP